MKFAGNWKLVAVSLFLFACSLEARAQSDWLQFGGPTRDFELIILDEDGNLALANATPTELKVISKASVLKNLAWTAPTLVGTKLYLRDRRTIAALDLK